MYIYAGGSICFLTTNHLLGCRSLRRPTARRCTSRSRRSQSLGLRQADMVIFKISTENIIVITASGASKASQSKFRLRHMARDWAHSREGAPDKPKTKTKATNAEKRHWRRGTYKATPKAAVLTGRGFLPVIDRWRRLRRWSLGRDGWQRLCHWLFRPNRGIGRRVVRRTRS